MSPASSSNRSRPRRPRPRPGSPGASAPGNCPDSRPASARSTPPCWTWCRRCGAPRWPRVATTDGGWHRRRGLRPAQGQGRPCLNRGADPAPAHRVRGRGRHPVGQLVDRRHRGPPQQLRRAAGPVHRGPAVRVETVGAGGMPATSPNTWPQPACSAGSGSRLGPSAIVQERHEFAPRVFPQPGDGRILPAPFGREVDKTFLRRGLRRCRVDRAEITGHFVPGLAGGLPERVADQVDDADSRCQPAAGLGDLAVGRVEWRAGRCCPSVWVPGESAGVAQGICPGVGVRGGGAVVPGGAEGLVAVRVERGVVFHVVLPAAPENTDQRVPMPRGAR